ncbi:hypothetical protein PLESTF_000590000 [Pleodorina starrii]|nr:hypothetical protein PLESTF_000590000 [Pleodorina starrii]
MLDYDDLGDLERYALAADTAERRQLLAVTAPGTLAVKPGQAFLTGLFALECNDLAAARDQVQRLKSLAPHSDYYRRLEALVALRSWSEDPAVTCAYLEESCGLDLNAPPPPPATTAVSEGQPVAAPHPSQRSQSAQQQGADSSVLDPSRYSDRSVLRKAVQMSRGSASGGPRGVATTLPKLLSRAGMAAVLSYEEEYDLGLTLDERLQLVGLGNIDGRFGSEQVVVPDLLSGSPLLIGLANEAAAAERGAAVEALLPYMTAEQLDELVASLPPAAAASPVLLAAAVRKMYGSRGAVSGVAAAVDVADGCAAAATSHPTPLLTAAEAAAIRRRVLQLCERIRARGAAGGEAVPERLAWLEARALLPLAEAAVQRAVAADAAASTAAAAAAAAVSVAETGEDAAAAAMGAVMEAAVDAEKLLARLLCCLEVHGVLPVAGYMEDSGLLARVTSPPGALLPVPCVNLGPALPPLAPNTGALVRKLLAVLLQVSPNPPALFAPGGSLAGKLNPAVQARLLSEAMLTRGSPSPPPVATGAHTGAAAATTTAPTTATGTAVDWAASYRDTGGQLASLAEVVELEVSGPPEATTGGEGPDQEDVVLLVSHKAVHNISVMVYDIATEAYYRQKGEEVSMGIDLEGLGPTIQMEIDLPPGLQPLQRCRRLVTLPQLKGRRGVWVVEVQGGGLQSRALLRRGSLAAVVRCSPAGMALTLFREDGSPVAEPRVWVDGRVYGPAQVRVASAAAGGGGSITVTAAPAAVAAAVACEVLVPYRAAEARIVSAVLVDGQDGFASLMSLQHVTEEYDFACGMHLELESAAAGGRGGTAPLLLQPSLTIGGWGAPLELLQDVSLTVEVQDFDSVIGGTGGGGGGARRQVFQDWNPGGGLQAAVVQVGLPDRPSRVTATLAARLRRMTHGSDGEPDYQTFRVERTWELNQSDLQSQEIRDLHLTRGSAGNYLLRLLGKAGEPHPGVQVVVALTHTFSAQPEPPPAATETARPAAGGGGAVTSSTDADADGSADTSGGTACGLVVRQALTTDANGSIDLGPLNGITAIAASVEIFVPAAAGSGGGGSSEKRRRRYCWPLPWRGAGGGLGPAAAASRGSAVKQLVFRTLAAASGAAAGDGGRLQCSIPCVLSATAAGDSSGATSSTAADEDPLQQQQQELRRRLGLALVSVAAAAAVHSTSVQARAPPIVLQAPLPAMPAAGPADWEVCERLDEQHVTVRQGQIRVSGLPPGVYGLYVSRLDLVVTILVYGGPVVGPAAMMAATPPPTAVVPPRPSTAAESTDDAGAAAGVGRAAGGDAASAVGGDDAAAGAEASFVLYRGLVAPLSEPRPLKITELRASVADGVIARLEGSEAQLGAAVVVAVLTRFEAHHSGLQLGGAPLPPLSPQQQQEPSLLLLGRQPFVMRSGVALGVPPPGSYQSGRRQSDEVRYVLERRRLVAEGRVRPMPALVDRPSLLVQPWKVRETATRSRTARKGEAFTDEGPRFAAAAQMCSFAAAAPCAAPMMQMGMMAGAAGGPPSCEFVAKQSVSLMTYEGDSFRRLGRSCGGPRVMQQPAGTLGLAFCPPAVVLPNVPVGPDGVVHLTAEQLAAAVAGVIAPTGVRMSAADPWVSAGHRLVRLIAYTAPAGIAAADLGTYAHCEERAAVEGVPKPSWTDPRVTTALQRPFPAGSACLERRTCHALQPGSDLVIADAATAKLQLYGTLPKVWSLYGSLLSMAPQSPVMPYFHDGASLWSQFSCVGGWFGLSSRHQPLVRSALLPRLRWRLPSSRNFLDSWLAGLRGRQLVDTWGAPHRYAKLTPLERILLAWEEDLLLTNTQHSSTSSSSPPSAAPSPPGAGSAEAASGSTAAAPGASTTSATTGAAASAAAAAPTPRLARLAADMRARIRRRVAALPSGMAASVAELKRQRFEIALNGPGDDDESQQEIAPPGVAAAGMSMAPTASSRGGFNVMGGPLPPPPPGQQQPPQQLQAFQAASLRSRNAADMLQRESMATRQQQAYRAPPATQEWAEAGWFRRPPSAQLDPDSISPESEFWADLAEHLSRGGRLGSCGSAGHQSAGSSSRPSATSATSATSAATAAAAAKGPMLFLPRNLESGGWGFSDALLATAVVGLPWKEEAPLPAVSQGTRLTLTATTPTVAYIRQTAAVPPAAAPAVAESGGFGASQQPRLQQQPPAGGSGGLLVIQRLLDPNLDPNEVVVRHRRGAPSAAAGGDGGGYNADEEGEEELEAEVAPTDCDGVELPPGSPLLYGRLYSYSVVASNTGPSGVRVDVTVQAPQGAVALGGRPALWVHSTEVPAYGACKLPPYYFYFPRPGGGGDGGGDGGDGGSAAAGNAPTGTAAAASWFDSFPAAASARGKVLAVALNQSNRVQVLPSLPAAAAASSLDLLLASSSVLDSSWSWPRLAALPASPEADAARLRYLEEGDLSSVDLGLMMWRCHQDAAFWRGAVAALRKRRAWSHQLWSYAVLHRDEEALRELLPSLEPLVSRLDVEAPAAATGALTITRPPGVEHSAAEFAASTAAAAIWTCADRFPHLEYWPLVNPRAHPLGGQRATLNEAMELSWRNLLARMAAMAAAGQAPSTEDLLAAAYYLILQDRPLEAGVLVDRLMKHGGGGVGGDEQALQLSYLRAWLVLADPSSSAEELRSLAAVLRHCCEQQAEGSMGAPTAAQDSTFAAGEETSSTTAAVVGLVSEPRWRSRLDGMVVALEDVAAAAANARGRQAVGGVPVSAASEGAVEGGGSVSSRLTAAPELRLYTSPEGPPGAVVLESAGVKKVTLTAHFMDLELLFSVSPFDTTLISNHSFTLTGAAAASSCVSSSSSSSSPETTTAAATRGSNKFTLLRPAWSTTLDIQKITMKAQSAGGDIKVGAGLRFLSSSSLSGGVQSKLLIQPQSLLAQKQPADDVSFSAKTFSMRSRSGRNNGGGSGAIMLEAFVARDGASSGSGAAADSLHRSLACYQGDMRVVVQKEQCVVVVTNIKSGTPLSGAYVKVYVQKDDDAAAAWFHKDGYTDRRGMMDFWTLTMKPQGKIRLVALLVSHLELGSTVLHLDPPLC